MSVVTLFFCFCENSGFCQAVLLQQNVTFCTTYFFVCVLLVFPLVRLYIRVSLAAQTVHAAKLRTKFVVSF